jgi:hypothetical protein
MSRFALNRRHFLRGVVGGVGAAVALPTLEVMLNNHGTAYAAGGELPTRFGVFFFGNGVRLNRYLPQGTGADWRLSEELASLVNVKDYINVVSGYRAKAGYGRRGHHDGAAAILSGIPFVELPHAETSYSSKFGGPTIDQVAADLIGNTTFRSLQVGVSKRVTTGEGPGLQYIAHRGPDEPLQPEYNPQALFTRLFASFTPKDPNDPTNTFRGHLLDAIREDARALHRSLGVNDRHRLDAHLTSIDQLQREISALPPVLTSGCVVPSTPATDNRDMNGQEPMIEVARAMNELVVLAMACDLTRVVSYMLTGGVGGIVYHFLGENREQHGLSHEPQAREFLHRAISWNYERFAHLIELLKNTPDGAENLLDHSVWLATTDVAEGESHSSDDYPIVIAGKGSGRLKYPGIHHRGTTANNTSDVLLSLMQAAGTGLTEIGRDQGYSNQRCEPIMA